MYDDTLCRGLHTLALLDVVLERETSTYMCNDAIRVLCVRDVTHRVHACVVWLH